MGRESFILVNEGIWCVVFPYDLKNLTMKTGKTRRTGYILKRDPLNSMLENLEKSSLQQNNATKNITNIVIEL